MVVDVEEEEGVKDDPTDQFITKGSKKGTGFRTAIHIKFV